MSSSLPGVTKVLPLESIEYTALLDKATFDQVYPGQLIEKKDGLRRVKEGWYVEYRHEQLSYYFGPTVDRNPADAALLQLESIVQLAVDQRPVLQSYTLEVVQLPVSKEPVPQKSSSNDPQPAAYPDLQSSENSQSSNPPSFWQKLLGWLGF